MKPYELGGYHFVLIEGEVYVRYSDVFEEEGEAEEEEQEEEEEPKPKKRGKAAKAPAGTRIRKLALGANVWVTVTDRAPHVQLPGTRSHARVVCPIGKSARLPSTCRRGTRYGRGLACGWRARPADRH